MDGQPQDGTPDQRTARGFRHSGAGWLHGCCGSRRRADRRTLDERLEDDLCPDGVADRGGMELVAGEELRGAIDAGRDVSREIGIRDPGARGLRPADAAQESRVRVGERDQRFDRPQRAAECRDPGEMQANGWQRAATLNGIARRKRRRSRGPAASPAGSSARSRPRRTGTPRASRSRPAASPARRSRRSRRRPDSRSRTAPSPGPGPTCSRIRRSSRWSPPACRRCRVR